MPKYLHFEIHPELHRRIQYIASTKNQTIKTYVTNTLIQSINEEQHKIFQ